jgi:hypothetical protein
MVRKGNTRSGSVSLLVEEKDSAKHSGNENNNDNNKEHKIVV